MLKNLAEATGPHDGTGALGLYLEAAQLRPEDVSLWSQVAILVSQPDPLLPSLIWPHSTRGLHVVCFSPSPL